MDRKFKVIVEKFPTFNKVGILIGKIVYNTGAKNGWHALEFSDGEKGLFAGEEIVEVFDKN